MTEEPIEPVVGEETEDNSHDYAASLGPDEMRAVAEFLRSDNSDSVADRTGELMSSALAVVNSLAKPEIGFLYNPDDESIAAPVVLYPATANNPAHMNVIQRDVFDQYLKRPRRRTGTSRATRLDSFIDITNRFRTKHSVLFAREGSSPSLFAREGSNPSLMAIFNYHESEIGFPPDTGKPDFADSRCVFDFPVSEEWKAWIGSNTKKMGLEDFAAFMEQRFVDVEHVTDVGALNEDIRALVEKVGLSGLASPSKMIELSRGLAVHESSVVEEVRNLASGEGQVRFSSEHRDAKGELLTVPSLFIINVPVWQRSEHLYRIAARLRYRKTANGLVFWYELWGEDRVMETAFTEACESAAELTGLQLFYGQPES